LARGACVTVNSDDPAYFGGYLNENFLQTTRALDLSSIEIKLLARNSFEASFLSTQEKERWYREIESLS
ncbi:MAG: adenosine deaminase, partial [Bacteriovoracia bacterium]